MIERFQGTDGKRRLIDALRSQQIVHGDRKIARDLAAMAELIEINPGTANDRFIKQNDADNDIFLILSGKVSVRVNGREVATREAGQHVGEMTAIDPSSRRIACVVVTEQTVMARFSESTFSELAEKHPVLWRRLAQELATRLRERGKLVSAKNTKPRIFIGSSSESLPIANAIHSALACDDIQVTIWTVGVFHASSSVIEDLITQVAESDFAILVLTPDDVIVSRRLEKRAPRDNCIFELGMFMGALGRPRTFIVKPKGSDIKIPSDLLGMLPLEFPETVPEDLGANLEPACNEIREIVNSRGPK